MSNTVTVAITGPVGCGKSAIYLEIMLALQALGIEVTHADPAAVQSEINMGFGDTNSSLELYKPCVLMSEQCESQHADRADFSAEQLAADPILRFFHYAHLPQDLQAVSKPFGDLARNLITVLPRNAERSVALRKLLEAKDAAVRANVW